MNTWALDPGPVLGEMGLTSLAPPERELLKIRKYTRPLSRLTEPLVATPLGPIFSHVMVGDVPSVVVPRTLAFHVGWLAPDRPELMTVSVLGVAWLSVIVHPPNEAVV
jgi:hypothetical protein